MTTTSTAQAEQLRSEVAGMSYEALEADLIAMNRAFLIGGTETIDTTRYAVVNHELNRRDAADARKA